MCLSICHNDRDASVARLHQCPASGGAASTFRHDNLRIFQHIERLESEIKSLSRSQCMIRCQTSLYNHLSRNQPQLCTIAIFGKAKLIVCDVDHIRDREVDSSK